MRVHGGALSQVDLRFPREGIDYDSLSEEEQAQWESLDWGDDEDDRGLPERVNASAINSWLFNSDTVDPQTRARPAWRSRWSTCCSGRAG